MLKQRYEAKQPMVCQRCSSKMLANNSNQKYCPTCIIDNITERRRINNARTKAKRKAEKKAAANGSVKCD